MYGEQFVSLSEALILWDHLETGIAKFTAVAAWFLFKYNVSMYVEMDLHTVGNWGTRVYSQDQLYEWDKYFFLNKNVKNIDVFFQPRFNWYTLSLQVIYFV